MFGEGVLKNVEKLCKRLTKHQINGKIKKVDVLP